MLPMLAMQLRNNASLPLAPARAAIACCLLSPDTALDLTGLTPQALRFIVPGACIPPSGARVGPQLPMAPVRRACLRQRPAHPQKPVSCHLYPIRTHTRNGVEKLNYDRWTICSPACVRGKTEGIKVYAFLKEPIIRKYGDAFFEALEAVEKSMPES